MAAEFVRAWSTLWTPGPGEDAALRRRLQQAAEERPLPPVTGEELMEAARTMPRRKAAGLDHWTVSQLRTLGKHHMRLLMLMRQAIKLLLVLQGYAVGIEPRIDEMDVDVGHIRSNIVVLVILVTALPQWAELRLANGHRKLWLLRRLRQQRLLLLVDRCSDRLRRH